MFNKFYLQLHSVRILLFFYFGHSFDAIDRVYSAAFWVFLEKMSCLNCLQVNNDAYHLKTRFYKSRQPLVVFSLNMVLNSKELCKGYCFCKNADAVCLVCQFKICYLNNKYDLYKNCLNWGFLSGFDKRKCEYAKLCWL